ncbi:MAG: hypothetical protein KAI24_22410 [Planctomycetes bacterium]|nr:hypothetical protein [Planctomycetota bacterium]
MRSIPTALSLLGLTLLAGCGTSSVIEKSRAFERRGYYQHAFEALDAEYQRQQADGEVSEALAKEHERMKLEALRDAAQTLIFREREDEALRVLDRLEKLDPDFRDLDKLRKHAYRKQAKALVLRGDEMLSQREFQQAMELYLESQRIVPGFEIANEGIERVKEELARMDAVAQAQFLQAVRKYPEFRHIEVAWHADSVLRNTPDPEDERRDNAQRLRNLARLERARNKFAEAKECELDNKFGAALVLYRQAQMLDAELEGVQEAVDKMKSELAALGLIESAQLTMRNGDFNKAQAMLEEAFTQSTLSRGAISELMIQNRRLKAEAEYRAARDLEVMGKKQEALAAFEALAEKWPDGFEDEAARIAALRVDIDGAKTEWQAAVDAEAAGDLEKALDHYINAERFYERWRDGEAHIERLQKAIAAKAEAAGSEGGS